MRPTPRPIFASSDFPTSVLALVRFPNTRLASFDSPSHDSCLVRFPYTRFLLSSDSPISVLALSDSPTPIHVLVRFSNTRLLPRPISLRRSLPHPIPLRRFLLSSDIPVAATVVIRLFMTVLRNAITAFD